MSRPTRSNRSVLVTAISDDDRNVFMGSLLYRLGLDLPLVERLQKAGKTQYSEVVPFMRATNMEPVFYLPHHSCAFVDDAKTADVLVMVINATMQRADAASLMRQQEAREAMEKGAKVVVLIDSI